MIRIVTTIGTLPADRRAPVLAALRLNLKNSIVTDIHIVTEAPDVTELAWLQTGLSDAESSKVRITQLQARPTLKDIFDLANRLFPHGTETLVIMNADIGIAAEQDAANIIGTLDILNGREEPVALTISRHEMSGDITLYEESGLPNFLSIDCWAFQRPINFNRELYYSLGQMNCDMLLTDDLLESGYRLYNPCLDIRLIHHEAEKSSVFYSEKNNEIASQEMLWRHADTNKSDAWNYYGTPWVKIDWIRRGYRPGPLSTHGRRIILALSEGNEAHLAARWQELTSVAERYNLEIVIVYEGELDSLVEQYGHEPSIASRIFFVSPRDGVDSLHRSLLAGKQYSAISIAFTSDVSRLDQLLLTQVHSVYLAIQGDCHIAQTPGRCTLITSVYQAEPFVLGFLRNCSELIAYGQAIEHILVVFALSDLEIDALSSHLNRFHSVTVLWFENDPGLYECWKIGINAARTDYVSNANVDDFRDPRQVVTLMKLLEAHPEVAVAATALVPFDDYPSDGELPAPEPVWYADRAGHFTLLDLARILTTDEPHLEPNNIPHCMPLWRRSLHSRYGWFDEARFGTYADWAFWLRVLRDDQLGWLHPEALSFYYVNLASHNRRGTNLEALHQAVENEFVADFLARSDGRMPPERTLGQNYPRKLSLYGQGLKYGEHRNAFTNIIHALDPLNSDADGYRFVPFLERQFVWGDSNAEGEAGSETPRPLTEPWVGILHVPFDTPSWFEPAVSPENIFSTPLFKASLAACRGLITLSADLERDLSHYLPGIPTLALRHPTVLDAKMFELKAYRASPRVVQVGDWLRKLQAIHRLKVSGHRRVMLLKPATETFMMREIEVFGDDRDPAVEMRYLVPDEEYDSLLASSVVLCLMYATAANNVVIECIARGTPIIINPLPGAVEYLGEDYPFYACDESEASDLLARPGGVEEAHRYLLRRRTLVDLSYSSFCYNLATSGFYANL